MKGALPCLLGNAVKLAHGAKYFSDSILPIARTKTSKYHQFGGPPSAISFFLHTFEGKMRQSAHFVGQRCIGSSTGAKFAESERWPCCTSEWAGRGGGCGTSTDAVASTTCAHQVLPAFVCSIWPSLQHTLYRDMLADLANLVADTPPWQKCKGHSPHPYVDSTIPEHSTASCHTGRRFKEGTRTRR